MLNRISKAISLILCFVCLSALLFSITGCKDEPPALHVFDFGTPEGFDELSAEEKFEWAKNNGYLVTSYIKELDKLEIYNEQLLDSFLENKTEPKELLILYYAPGDVRVSGIYFDGKYYHATRGRTKTTDATAFHYYEICRIEYDNGYKFLCVSNDANLTVKDEFGATLSSDMDYHYDFFKKHYRIATLDKE